MKTLFKISITIVAILFATHEVFSQEELSGKLDSMMNSSNPVTVLAGNHLNNLVYSPGATLYYKNGLIKVGNDTAYRLTVNANSFELVINNLTL